MKIAIAGYGIEGASSYLYYAADPANEITIFDQHRPSLSTPAGVMTIVGEDAYENLNGFDLVIRTAGLDPAKIKTDGKIWSATNEFFDKCPAQIIGVTGTKGKGTTASLIASIFEAAGKTVWLVGNIGKSAIEILSQVKSEDVVVFELSSFQLWDLERSPHVAVVLLIEPDHLNVHVDFDDYVAAKTNIRRYQNSNDICIFHPTNAFSLKIAESSSEGAAFRYGVPDGVGVYVKEESFYEREHKICSVSALQLIGNHNVENACAAISVAKYYDVSDKNIEVGLKTFQGLPHRLEYIREIDGVKYYNDSFSSAPSATIAAIKSFSQPEVIILGGIDKGADFTELARVVANSSNIKKIVIMGEARNKLSVVLKSVDSNMRAEVTDLKDLRLIVDLAKSYTQPGDVVILSPGCASFDMFENFYDRGDQFRNIVSDL